MAREVSEQSEWDALLIGTATRIKSMDMLDDGTEVDVTLYVIRDFRCDAGKVADISELLA